MGGYKGSRGGMEPPPLICIVKKNRRERLKGRISNEKQLTLKVPIPQNDQTHSNNSSATVDGLFECVWPFCKVGT